MDSNQRVDIEEAFEEGTLVDEAVQAAADFAVRQHQFSGLPMPAWRDGKVVWISPFDGSVVDDPAAKSVIDPAA